MQIQTFAQRLVCFCSKCWDFHNMFSCFETFVVEKMVITLVFGACCLFGRLFVLVRFVSQLV